MRQRGMDHGQDGNHAQLRSSGIFTAFRLKPGEDLLSGMRAAFDGLDSDATAIMTCVGSLTRVVIRHANKPEGTLYEGHFEITSLVGAIDRKGEHVHITITDGNGKAWGGHLLPGSSVYTTAEIVLLDLPELIFTREPCEASGYDELVIGKKKGD